MLTIFTCLLSLFTIFSPAPIPENIHPEKETLEIKFKYNSACKGKILISCFQESDYFLDSKKATYSAVLDCQENLFIKNIDSHLPRAVMAFMDENGNGEIDLNVFGIPTEPYALSNGARGKWKEPDFEEAAEPAYNKTITLEFNYWKDR